MEEQVLKLILSELTEMKGSMSELKSDMKEVKGRLTGVENRLINVENRLTNVENRLTKVENKLTNVEDRLTNVETDMTEVKGKLNRIEELAEFNYDTCQTIMQVSDEHFREFRQFIKKNNEDHQRYNSKIIQYKVEEDKE